MTNKSSIGLVVVDSLPRFTHVTCSKWDLPSSETISVSVKIVMRPRLFDSRQEILRHGRRQRFAANHDVDVGGGLRKKQSILSSRVATAYDNDALCRDSRPSPSR